MMDLRALAMGVAFAFIWSSAFASARVIVAHAPPLTALSVRFLISGLIALAIARALGERMRLTPAQWQATIVFGLCQNGLYLGLNFYAMQTVEASLAAIIASTMPLMVAAAGRAVFGTRLSWVALSGLVAGFSGVAVIMGGRMGAAGLDGFGVFLCFVGAAALATATLLLRQAAAGGNIMTVVGLQMLVGAVATGAWGLAAENFELRWSWPFVAAFTYTLVFPGIVATWIWFALVERIGAVRAATFHFLNPFFGVLVAWALLAEPLRLWDAVGVLIVMAGILAVQLDRARHVPA